MSKEGSRRHLVGCLFRRLGIPFAAAFIAASIAPSIAPVRLAAGFRATLDQHDLKPLVGAHEFMEHIVQGTFAAVKRSVHEKTPNNNTWQTLHNASLLLGESGNLLLIRCPDGADELQWASLSIALRESGDALAKAAKTKNQDASLKAYHAVVQSCNQCHAHNGDDGEPKIEP